MSVLSWFLLMCVVACRVVIQCTYTAMREWGGVWQLRALFFVLPLA